MTPLVPMFKEKKAIFLASQKLPEKYCTSMPGMDFVCKPDCQLWMWDLHRSEKPHFRSKVRGKLLSEHADSRSES